MRLRFLLPMILLVLIPAQAVAFCGFYVGGGDASLYNDATQVVLMRHDKTTVLSMQNKYEGPTADFAMVVPVPQILQKENVKTLKKSIFDRVDTLSAPRLVEYWERDPCNKGLYGRGDGFGGGGIGIGGLGMRGSGRGGGGYVQIKAQFEVGEYEVAILDTNDAATLEAWLKKNKYKIPAGAAPYFKPYIQSGMYFFVAKVNAKKVTYKDGKAVLSPLRFHYQSKEFTLPIRLGMINSKGQQDLLVYILATKDRYEAANYKNVTIPTNIEVGPNIKGKFGEFYESLFSRTVETNPNAVVTEYSWAAQKCDPCPSGILGGSGLRQADLKTLGNDILKRPNTWNSPWVLTRLHARYKKDGIGEDLVFRKADPMSGGREVRKEDGSLEKGTATSSTNNFQGRYIIRNEWEGTVKCEAPAHGIWGGPPDPHGMRILAEAIVTEMRRSRAATENREPTEAELEAERTPEEEAAVAFQMRRKFGTSAIPQAAGTQSAPSPNTLGAAAKAKESVDLQSIIREPVPELKLTPSAVEPSKAALKTTPSENPAADQAPAKAPASEPASEPAPAAGGCAVGLAAPGPWGFLVLLGLMMRRRRRSN